MITGLVRNLECHVELEVFDKDGISHRLQTIVDTGYTGCLTVHPEFIRLLGLQSIGKCRGVLADGSEVLLQEFLGTITWHDRPLEVRVTEANGGSLLGMELLAENRLTLDAVEGGEVTIEEILS